VSKAVAQFGLENTIRNPWPRKGYLTPFSPNFSVAGPTGSILPSASLQTDDTATVLLSPTGNPAQMKMSNSPQQPGYGVWFEESTAPNQGQFIWVQILNSVTYSQIEPANPYSIPSDVVNELDGIYPYPSTTPQATADSPGRYAYAGEGEDAEAFDATMYVLWDPAIPPQGKQSCTPAWTDTSQTIYVAHASDCASIPVPLGSVRWKWSACAINQLGPPPPGGTAPSPSWIKQCGPAYSYGGTASGYPTWTSCSESAHANCK
jgi:hypothetical protein